MTARNRARTGETTITHKNYRVKEEKSSTHPFCPHILKGSDLLKIVAKIKSKILELATWAEAHLEKLIILIGVFIMGFILFVLMSWGVGYYANGFYGLKFDLGSIWQGLGACVAAISGLLTMAGVDLAKRYIDSKYNSAQGEAPSK